MKIPRPISRPESKFRDASTLLIASEDKVAVERYFSHFVTRRVNFYVIPTENNKSSPAHVLQRLNDAALKYDIGEGDELWLCLDTDHWIEANHIATLKQVAQECRQKGYKIAMSFPCFEAWLWMHYFEPTEIEDSTHPRCKLYYDKMREKTSYYKNASSPLMITESQVEHALSLAKSLWKECPENWYLETLGSQVYRLIEVLKQKDCIRLRTE